VRFKNVSGGAREVPLLAELGQPGIVEADEIIEVADEVADGYVWPEDTWQVAGNAEQTVEELRAELRARDLPTSGTKAELLERLANADKGEGG
jgi:hypothetical protein